MKTNKTRTKKPENRIGREDSAGQNPFWPGQGNQNAGQVENDNTGEKTTIPIVDSIAHKKNTTT